VECRKLLRLDDHRSDFYITGALASVAVSTPLLRGVPDDVGAVFSADLVMLQVPSVTGATALAWEFADGTSGGREGFTEVVVVRRGGAVELQTDNGRSNFAEFTFSNSTLSIPALSALGAPSRFATASWSEGQTIRIKIPQTGYPYAGMAATIADSSAAIQLMSEEGVLEAFASAVRPIYKVGALACAIIRRMATISASGADEFSVEADTLQADDFILRQISVDWTPVVLDGQPITYAS
jgi:hypothetical protein